MNKKIEIYSLILGSVFLLSGFAKSLNISDFAMLIANYGFDRFQFLAPIIVLSEIFLGLLLLFQISLKKTAFIGGLLVSIFTVIYSYELIFNGIQDCGCFGRISILNSSPIFTFIRNVILLLLFVIVWRKAENRSIKANKSVVGVVLLVLCIASFISGYGYYNVTKSKSVSDNKWEVKADFYFKKYANISSDSTYLIFVFTYTCPHCLNSIENLKGYKSFGLVDNVIGLAVNNEEAERKFRKIFEPNFPIKNYSSKEIAQLTNSYPTAYYIKHNSILAKISGELPCAYVLQKRINAHNH